MVSNEQRLREKVWEILNTIQANQIFVHSAVMEIPIDLKELGEQTAIIWQDEGFLNKIRDYFSKSNLDELESKDNKTKGGKKSKSKKKSSKKSKNTKSIRVIELPEILSITLINAIVPNSAMLLIGGHGGGKSSLVKHLGRMFTGMSLMDAEDCIIRGHPQLTEEKMIATLNIAKLLKGKEEVLWRTFTTGFWKILDEVNRLSPYAQNILLSMLAEGKVKYYDYVYPTEKYVLYATLNPGDVGTFEMSPPFLDRFGISVNISMPTTHDLSIILESRDDKLVGYDELMQIPAILNKEQLLSIWFMVDRIKINKSAENFIHSIVRDFTLCERMDKGNSEYLTPESGLCSGCHFNLAKLVCNKVTSILSVRVAKDLLRYSKALTWVLGLEEVSINIVSAIAPYVISHRVSYVERDMNEAPYWGNKFDYTVDLIKKVKNRFINREECYDIIDNFRDGKGNDSDITYLNGFKGSDLITKMDLIPLAESLNNREYKKTVSLIDKYYDKQNLVKLVEINDLLMKNLTFPNRGELISKINKHLKELTYWAREFTFKRWDIVRHTISGMYANFSKQLEISTMKQCTLQLRDKNLFLEVNVAGTELESMVQVNCHGGKEANELKKVIDENYPKDMYDFSAEIVEMTDTMDEEEKIDDKLDEEEPLAYKMEDGTKRKTKEKKRDIIDEVFDEVEDILKED